LRHWFWHLVVFANERLKGDINMNTEKLRAEFEEYALKSGKQPIPYDNGRDVDIQPFSSADAWEFYQAAASSRDELIGKLYKAVNNWIPQLEPYDPHTKNKTYQLRNDQWKQDCDALAAIEPYLTKEGDWK
jgi:hypothetical protein